MADSVIVQKLDTRLIEEGVLDNTFEKDYSLVHQMLNEEIRKTGKFTNFELGEKILRDWLNGLARQGASQDKLTNYLRCGLAHLSYEYIESDNEGTDVETLILRALVSFRERDFEKSIFRSNDGDKAVAQKAVAKEKVAVKKAAKKAAKKKAAKKKVAKKKSAPKKKKAAKKKVAKKKTPKKTAKKKTTKKKTSKKKTKKR
ncbi:hypothetical protein LEP1GSC060_1600 [Leptospira weilii serovar Ranarum str. ICFT]|uniref:Uncharacterized protein n=1 Tax=Leptospira weilii serovar Ranarum str. ICFT TaxID=1218598 RepID=N1WGN4_9LEPT|nr:hypothetical protein [Leptospira weilii]EMY76299.1 hypothetical protein LEP1GSC060_1600 [Leptospira weilii serovar Ranarum str. ICFT]